MADQKISAMPSASTLTGAELLPLVQGGANVQATVSALKTFADPEPYIEVATTVGTTLITTTPQLLKPTTIVGLNPGIAYDSATGEFTFNVAGNYGLSIAVNAIADNSGESIYWYAENNNGAGWIVNINSGKSFSLANNSRAQVFAANFTRRTAGQKVRYWIYSTSDTKVNIAPTTLGATGAIVPAIRVQYSG